MSERNHIEVGIVRHGSIANLSSRIEKGEKPPYEDFKGLIEGIIDPPIDEEETREIIQNKIKEGKIGKDINIIICSPTLRATQTAKLIKEIVGLDIPVHSHEYLREINLPMEDITPEFYEQAKDIYEIRKKILDSFLSGKKIDEDIVGAYHRAQRFLIYLRRIRRFTGKKPLFITHGIFARFLELAINHQEEELNDDQIKILVQNEFQKTSRPGVLEGFSVTNTQKGSEIVGLI